jgi:LysR family hydrogen peroxide-inducible transcriptional activator
MTLRELRYLVALADRGHFGRAARDCHVSQPTLSTQIRKLEDYLGVTLIERTSKTLALTAVGEDVVRSARVIISEADALLARTRVPRGPLAGRLIIGVFPTLGPYFLPSFIPLTKAHYPRLHLVVHEDLTAHLLERLTAGQIDAALLALPITGTDLEVSPLFDEPFWFACAPSHPLAGTEVVTDAELAEETLLLLADGHCLRGQALAACGREEDETTDDFRAASLETLCQLVSEGLGSTLLPGLAARRPPSALVVRPLRTLHDRRRIGLVFRQGSARAQELRMLAQLVRKHPPEGTHAVPEEAQRQHVPGH